MRHPSRLRQAKAALIGLLLGLAVLPAAHAHLMVAQRGTLNLVGDGAFMVLSLPVTAFKGVDDDHDGLLSPAELQAHADAIETQVQRGVQLRDGNKALALQGVMLQLSPPDHTTAGASDQIVVLGRFALGGARSGLRLRMDLFGSRAQEQAQEITVSRADQAQRMLLAPGRNEGDVFPTPWATFSDYVAQGATHVLSGPDHLLFLLVVLVSGLGLRQALLALTCFTVGHAVTLGATVLRGLSVPAAIVEPAIAATIVGMALFDHWSRRRTAAGLRAPSSALRLALVFACSLIHGLGLAGALEGLGLDSAHRWLSLAGFNLGIELAQVGVALSAGALLLGLRHLSGPAAPVRVAQLASITALVVGSFWLVQRVSGLA